MTAPASAICAGVSAAVFNAIACRSAAEYGLGMSMRRASAILPAAIAVAGCAWRPSWAISIYASPVLAGCLAASTASDVQTGYVFDRVLLLASALLAIAAIDHGRVADGIAGAIVCGGSFALVHAAGRGRTLGLGDVKLAAVIGCGLGPSQGLTALWFAVVSGGIAALYVLVVRRADRFTSVPFAPYLAAGTLCAVLHLS